MTDRKALVEQNETPEDVATLYSWANLHGAKYRDFSAARAQTREKARLRVQQALEEQREEERQQVALEQAAPLRLTAPPVQNPEQAQRDQAALEQAARQEAARQAAQLAAQKAAEQAAQLAAQQAAQLEAGRLAAQQTAARRAQEEGERRAQEARAAEQVRAVQFAAEQARAAERAAEQSRELQQAAEQARAALHAAEHAQAAQRVAEEARAAEQRRAAEQIRAAQLAAAQAQAAQRAAEQARAAEQSRATQFAAEQAQAAERATAEAEQARQALQQIRAAQQAAWQQTAGAPAPAPAPQSSYFAPQSFAAPYRAPSYPDPGSQPAYAPAPAHEEPPAAPRPAWVPAESPEAVARPAWLNVHRPPESAAAPALQPLAPADTLQGQRDRMTSRWFALKGVFQGGMAPAEPAPAAAVVRAPVVAIFSLAGGVGKTSLTANLGRALSARGERVLLVDTAPYGLLPFYFGACDQRPGQLRTFTAPGSGDAPVQMLTLDPDAFGPETAQQEPLSAEVSKYATDVNCVLVDLATASSATVRRVLRLSPLVLVPVMPDMNSVVSVSAIHAFFQRTSGSGGHHAMPFYVLNQFDASLPLHLDVREVLREQLGERLLPFALRRAPAVSEALAEGMTVMDYAPHSTVAEDFTNLAGWVKSQSAPASSGFRGVRWSER